MLFSVIHSVLTSIIMHVRNTIPTVLTQTEINLNSKRGWTRWAKAGDQATHPLASYNNSTNSNKASTRYLESADFLKLRSVTLGYNFSLKSEIIKALRVYISGENLFCITGYSGVDPELPASDDGRNSSGERSTALSVSAGPGVYPSVRKFMLGVNVTF